MLGRLFDNPITLLVLLLIILLIFGAPKLPGMARSLGQSMRIFKSEVSEMKKSDSSSKDQNRSQTIVNGEVVDNNGVSNNSDAHVDNQGNPGPSPDQTTRAQS